MNPPEKAGADPRAAQQGEWWWPENLIADDRRISQSEDLTALDPRTDFGSYRMLCEGIEPEATQIATHNDVQPAQKVAAIARLLRISEPTDILDAGCGVGYTTAALAKHYPRAKVLGVDVSTDGISYAQRTHSKGKFMVAPLSPEAANVGCFDLIFCFEFYPFSRNANTQVQRDYIEYFVDQLNENGQLVIYQTWNNARSLSAVYDSIVQALPNLQFTVYKIPHPKLLDRFPWALAQLIAVSLGMVTGRELLRKVLVIDRRGSTIDAGAASGVS